MKAIAVFVSFIGLGAAAVAKELPFPSDGEALFTITIPDDWKPNVDQDKALDAFSPSEKIYLSMWKIEHKAEMRKLDNEIVDLLKDHAKNVKISGDPIRQHKGDLDSFLYEGAADAMDDGHAIRFYTLILANRKQAAAMFIEADSDASAEEAAQLKKITESITPVKGESPLVATLEVEGKPVNAVTTDAPQLQVVVVGKNLKLGAKVHAAWIAEDVGDAMAPNTVLQQTDANAENPTDKSTFTLQRPQNGWAPGKYRVEISTDGEIAATLPFVITKP